VSNNSDGFEVVFGLLAIVVIIYFIIYVVLPVIAVAGSTGALLGSGHAIYNYGLAAKRNIEFE
jgi:hypothetical protein